MANNIKGITIEIGGDTTKLDKALGGVNKNVKSTQAELREVEKLLKLDPKNTEALAQKQQLLTKAVGETKEKLDVLKTAEAQVEEQFKKGEVSEEQYRAIKREIEATELSLKKLEEEAGKSNLSLEKVGEAFGKVGGKATDIGNKLLPVTAGVTALGGAGVAAAMELDDGYDTIITKTGATGEALEELNGIADDLFTEMPIEMQDAGTAVGEINTRFGATGDTLKDLSKQFIEFANINDTDLNNSIGKTDKIMEQYNMDASETGNVLGLLTKKGQETGISVDTLMDSLQKNGATFKEMGLNLVQSTNLLAQFEANGGQVLDSVPYQATDQDFAAILTTVKSLDPDCIALCGTTTDGALIIKQARQMGIEAPIMGQPGLYSQNVIDIAGDALKAFFAAAYS